MEEVVVHAPSRLHLGLIDLSNTTARKYGGAGVMLSEPNAIVRVRADTAFNLESEGLDPEYKEAIIGGARRIAQMTGEPRCRVVVERLVPAHVGLGSKTTVVLAALSGINHFAHLGLSAADLQLISGRGGTSGIGINGYFCGGFVVDAGQPVGGSFQPSSATRPATIPPITVRCPVPPDWRFSLLLPKGRRLSGSDESEFFRSNTPISSSETLEVMALVYHGLVPAFITSNLSLVRDSLARIQRIGFKRREVDAQSEGVKGVLRFLNSVETIAAGMSSIGPLVFAIRQKDDLDALSRIRRYAAAEDVPFVADTAASVSGALETAR